MKSELFVTVSCNLCLYAAMEELGECLEHKIIRTNLANITQLISSDPSAGPTWFALKLEEKAFIASAADAVVSGCSTSRQTSALLGAVKSKITTSQEPKKEFAKFIEILRSNPPLEGLAKELVQECGEFTCTLECMYTVLPSSS